MPSWWMPLPWAKAFSPTMAAALDDQPAHAGDEPRGPDDLGGVDVAPRPPRNRPRVLSAMTIPRATHCPRVTDPLMGTLDLARARLDRGERMATAKPSRRGNGR